jgi:hypothetical protein
MYAAGAGVASGTADRRVAWRRSVDPTARHRNVTGKRPTAGNTGERQRADIVAFMPKNPWMMRVQHGCLPGVCSGRPILRRAGSAAVQGVWSHVFPVAGTAAGDAPRWFEGREGDGAE